MIVVEVLSCCHRSQAAGRGATGFEFATGFDLRQLRPFALAFFLFALLFRFTAPLSQELVDASKTSLLSNQ